MRFRPCIDIHNGKVKQIVGSSLRDEGDEAAENFVSDRGGDFYANFYKKDNLRDGHVILLNPASSPSYEATKAQALRALAAWPGGLELGGGVNDANAEEFLTAGASHVIVTSFVFAGGQVNEANLARLVSAVGREHLVLDLSCRMRDGEYYIVTDRWQKFTDIPVNGTTLNQLASDCDEFLIHAVDVEGKASGVEEDLLRLLGGWDRIPVTYAGGVAGFADLAKIRTLGRGHIDVTIGSALDLFGGNLPYRDVLRYIRGDDHRG